MTVLTEKNPRVSRPMKFKRVGLTGQLYRHCPLMTFRSAMGPAHRTGAPQSSRSQVPCLKRRHLCSGGLSSGGSRTQGRGSRVHRGRPQQSAGPCLSTEQPVPGATVRVLPSRVREVHGKFCTEHLGPWTQVHRRDPHAW